MSAFKRQLAFVVALVTIGGSGLLLNAQLPQAVGTWADGGLVTSRIGSAAVSLPDGRTLIVAGRNADTATSEVLVYDPVSGTTNVAGHLVAARTEHAAVLLKDGRVLVAGGLVDGTPSADIEFFDPATGTSAIGATMLEARSGLAAARLSDDSVLLVGGSSNIGLTLNSAERFDPETGSIAPTGALAVPRREASATTLHDGRVVVAGGSDGTTDLRSAEIYTPYAGAFVTLESELSGARRGHIALLLPNNGSLMIAGGFTNGEPQSSVDLYLPAEFPDPYSYSTSQFSSAVSMAAVRAQGLAGAAALEGHIFVSGGGSAAAETYRFPTIRTDKDDYAPGQLATITGTGWEAGEVVTLRFQEDPAVHDDYVLTVTADGEGRIFWDQWAPEEHDLGVRFYLIARGDVSGRVAQTTFTDGQPLILSVSNALISPDQPSSAGVLDSTTITAKNQGGGGLSGFEIRIRNSSNSLVRTFLIGNVSSNAEPTRTWNGRNDSNAVLPDGVYVVRAFATGAGENTAANDSEVVTIDNTNPTVTLTSPADGATLPTSVNLVVAPLDAGGNDQNIDRVEFFVDGNSVGNDSNGNNGWSRSVSPSPTPGAHTWFVRVFDKAGNNIQSATRSFTFGTDNTPPVITATVSGVVGNNDWYTSNVKITWTVTDAQSTITNQNGCGETNLTTDTSGITYTCTATSAGGTASQSVTVKRDASAPNAPNGVRTPAANGAGWNNTDVTVTFEAAGDNGPSGIASCSGPSTLTTETAGSTISGTCTDLAGNQSTATDVLVKIDKTVPLIAGSRAPAANAAGWNNTDVVVSFTCSDDGLVQSGIGTNTVAGATVTTEGVGQSVTSTGLCVDAAGNAAAAATVGGINVDKTKPVITPQRSPESNSFGWNNTDVTVSFTCADPGAVSSGLAINNVAGTTVTSEASGLSVTNSGTCVDNAGNAADSSTVSDIRIDKTAPAAPAGSRSPEANAAGWNNQSPVSVSFASAGDVGSVQSGIDECTAGEVVTGETAGMSVVGTCRDRAGNVSADTTVVVKIDLTKPVITGQRSPDANSFGWKNTDVTVSFTCADAGAVSSGLATNDVAGTTVTNETDGLAVTNSGTCVDNAGNAADSSTVSDIRIDKTAPAAPAGSRSPEANAAGWNNQSPVTVSFTAQGDPGSVQSGIDECTASEDVTGETAGTSIVGTCRDRAGNVSADTTVVVKIDLTKPVITGQRSPEANTFGWNNTDVTVSFTCADAGAVSAGLAINNVAGTTVTTETSGLSVTNTGSCVDNAGNAADASTVSDIRIDKTAPAAPTGARSPEANAAGWNNQSPVTVSFTAQGDVGSVQSGIDECTASEDVTGETAGTSVVGTCRDRAGNVSADTTVVVKIDLTKPVITGQRSPDANGFGWNNTDVAVTFTCADNGSVQSGIGSNTVAGATVSSEGANQSVTNSGVCVDVAGNSANAAAVGGINIDKTAPTISGSLDKAPAATGWFNIATGGPKAQFSCGDPLSGIADGPCPFETAPLGDGAGQSVSHTVTDKAGNSATAIISGINVDLTAPTITITSPSNSSYVLNAVAHAAYSCNGGVSGLGSCSGPVANGSAFNTASVGAKTFAVSAMDIAGNPNTAQVGYNVVYATGPCLGSPSRQILQPVNADGSSVFKQKSTVPSKFRVCDANGVSIGTPGVVTGYALTAVYLRDEELPINETIVSTTPDTTFRWSDNQWIFNLSTKNLTAGRTYTYTVYLNDGTQFSYGFTLK